MSSHQDWETIVIRGNTGRRSAGGTSNAGKKMADISSSKKRSQDDDVIRLSKLDNDTEHYSHKTVSRVMSNSIVAARNSIGWNRKQLAGAMSIPEKTVSDYETGKAIPNERIIRKLERVLRTSLKR